MFNIAQFCKENNICIVCHKREPEEWKNACARCAENRRKCSANQRVKIKNNSEWKCTRCGVWEQREWKKTCQHCADLCKKYYNKNLWEK